MNQNKIIINILAIMAFTNSALAETATNNMQINTTVSASCRMNADNISFGELQNAQTSPSISVTSNIFVTCTKGTYYRMLLSAGESDSFSMRNMIGSKAGNTSWLAYNVYTRADHSVVFGQGTAPTMTINGTGTGNTVVTSIYSRLDGGHYATPDNYSDTLTLTVIY